MYFNIKKRESFSLSSDGKSLLICQQIPATESGILAAQRLQKNQVNVNLYLVSSLLHAGACAETNPAAISVPVGNVSFLLLLLWAGRELIVDIYTKYKSYCMCTNGIGSPLMIWLLILGYKRYSLYWHTSDSMVSKPKSSEHRSEVWVAKIIIIINSKQNSYFGC